MAQKSYSGKGPKLVFRKTEIHSDRFRELSNRRMTFVAWDSLIGCLVNDSMRKAKPFVVKERDFGKELPITRFCERKVFRFNQDKEGLEKLRPPSVTEILLSNDGEMILEGCLTNLFIVCRKEKQGVGNTIEHNELQNSSCIEIQTAPLSDDVLPGILQQDGPDPWEDWE